MPPGGWHLPQQLSSGTTIRLEGFTFEQLLENVLDFRRRHLDLCGGAVNATIEKVRADLKDYVCQHFRQNCADSPGTPQNRIGIGVTNYQRPIDRAADWLARIGSYQIDKVDAALAAQRAHVCASCPQNVRWATPCAPCNDNVLVRIQNAKGSLSTPYDRNLFVCRIYGHTNEVAVWLADTHSTSELKAPDICWHNNHG
jgi:hypothetical protein